MRRHQNPPTPLCFSGSGSRQASLEEPLFAPGAQEAEEGGREGVYADGEFIPMEHYSQRAQWLRAGERLIRATSLAQTGPHILCTTEEGGGEGVCADGDFTPMGHYSQRAQRLRAGESLSKRN